MKKIVLLAMVLICVPLMAIAGQTYYVEIAPTVATYGETPVRSGLTVYDYQLISEASKRGDRMGFSGTSTCAVIDLSRMDYDGYLTFQFKSLTGTTGAPVSGTSVSVHWRGSNVDSPWAWSVAHKNTLVNGINALTGATGIGYDLNNINGVTAFRYHRFEFESGISKSMAGDGNLIPIGVLFVR